MKYRWAVVWVLLFGLMGNTWAKRVPFDAPQNAMVMEWRDVPLKVTIPVKEDRVIRFTQTSRLQVGVPTNLQGIVSVESFNGVAYLRSESAFEALPFWFRDKNTNKIYRIDIKATPGGDGVNQPVIVIDPERPAMPDEPPAFVDGELPETAPDELVTEAEEIEPRVYEEMLSPDEPIRHGIGTLTRFAFQHLYAPERLIKTLDDVYQMDIEERTYQHIHVGNQVNARPIAQWSNEGRYVTALLLENMGNRVVRLDPRMFRGNRHWETASLISDTLEPNTMFGDHTALVVISDKPWEDYEQWLD